MGPLDHVLGGEILDIQEVCLWFRPLRARPIDPIPTPPLGPGFPDRLLIVLPRRQHFSVARFWAAGRLTLRTHADIRQIGRP